MIDDLSADDFEFVDPEYSHLQASGKAYELATAQGQSALITDLARNSGVQTVLLSDVAGQVISQRGVASSLFVDSIVAKTTPLLRQQGLNLVSAQFVGATVCMRQVSGYCVVVVARDNINIGRLLSELQQIEVA